MDASKRAVLRRVPAFAELTDSDCDAVLRVLRARRGAARDVLFREGETGSSLMIVLEGELVARVRTAAGDREVARLGPGEIVGELAFIDSEARSATVSAGNAPVTVLDFTRDALGVLVRDAPRAAAAILRHVLGDLARRLRDAGETLSDGASSRDAAGPVSVGRLGAPIALADLQRVPAFASYAEADLELLSHIAILRHFAGGDVLMRAGAAGDSCFLIATGKVAISRPGVAKAIAELGPGALVGQLALLDRAPRSATVTALGSTAALELRGDAFANLVRASTPVALRFQWQVALAGAKQLRVATQRLAAAAAFQDAMVAGHGGPRGMDDWDDWDNGGPAVSLELDVDPNHRAHRS